MTTDHIYPCTIIVDRYSGTYSGGAFTAWNEDESRIPSEISDGDCECADFWDSFKDGEEQNMFWQPLFCGKGATPNEAYEDLIKKISALNL